MLEGEFVHSDIRYQHVRKGTLHHFALKGNIKISISETGARIVSCFMGKNWLPYLPLINYLAKIIVIKNETEGKSANIHHKVCHLTSCF